MHSCSNELLSKISNPKMSKMPMKEPSVPRRASLRRCTSQSKRLARTRPWPSSRSRRAPLARVERDDRASRFAHRDAERFSSTFTQLLDRRRRGCLAAVASGSVALELGDRLDVVLASRLGGKGAVAEVQDKGSAISKRPRRPRRRENPRSFMRLFAWRQTRRRRRCRQSGSQ